MSAPTWEIVATVRPEMVNGALMALASLRQVGFAGRTVIFMESDTVRTEEGLTVPRRVAWLTPHNGMIAGVRGYVGEPFVLGPSYAKILEQMGKPLFT